MQKDKDYDEQNNIQKIIAEKLKIASPEIIEQVLNILEHQEKSSRKKNKIEQN